MIAEPVVQELEPGVFVVRDDLLVGGTKRCYADHLIRGNREVVYASPAYGGAQIAIAEELTRGGGGRKTQPRVAFRFATPVFDSHVERIGLLNPDVSFKLSSLYGHILAFNTQAQDQVPDMDPALAARVMRSVEENLKALAGQMDALRADLGGMVAGLR